MKYGATGPSSGREITKNIHSASRSKPGARSVCVCLGLSVSVCQSVCLGRAGHMDKHSKDVNNANFTGLHSWHRKRLPSKPHHFFLKQHQKPSQAHHFHSMRGPPKLKLLERIDPAAILRLVRASTTPPHVRCGRTLPS